MAAGDEGRQRPVFARERHPDVARGVAADFEREFAADALEVVENFSFKGAVALAGDALDVGGHAADVVEDGAGEFDVGLAAGSLSHEEPRR